MMKRFLRGGSIESKILWSSCFVLALSIGCTSPRRFGRSATTPTSAGSARTSVPRAQSNLRAIRPAPPPLPPIYPDETKEGSPWSGLQLAMQASAQGILVGVVSRGSPADLAGMQPGDFIFQLDGRSVNDAREVLSEVERVGVGGSVRLGVHRAERVRLFRVEPVAKPSVLRDEAGEEELPSATLEGKAPSTN
jgi:hypothetical protein